MGRNRKTHKYAFSTTGSAPIVSRMPEIKLRFKGTVSLFLLLPISNPLSNPIVIPHRIELSLKRDFSFAVAMTSQPSNESELQLYRVLQRANLLAYFDTFICQGKLSGSSSH